MPLHSTNLTSGWLITVEGTPPSEQPRGMSVPRIDQKDTAAGGLFVPRRPPATKRSGAFTQDQLSSLEQTLEEHPALKAL